MSLGGGFVKPDALGSRAPGLEIYSKYQRQRSKTILFSIDYVLRLEHLYKHVFIISVSRPACHIPVIIQRLCAGYFGVQRQRDVCVTL